MDIGGSARSLAVGFSIGSKGYVGTGYWHHPNMGYYDKYSVMYQDFWEFNPALDTWTPKAAFGGHERFGAVGWGNGKKGYIGTGIYYYDAWPYSNYYEEHYSDFWEYDQALNSWSQKADFGITARMYSIGFGIGGKGYVGTGYDPDAGELKDFWEYTPEANAPDCTFPATLATSAITSNTATLKWSASGEALSYKVRYKIAGTSAWTFVKAIDHAKTIHALLPSTEYVWQVKSFCETNPVV